MSDLSAIIVTRNTRELTRLAVRSVFESHDALSKELVVVDNGSNDNTPEILLGEFPALQCVKSDVNLGFAKAINLGATRTKGDFLLFLNSDARLKPEALARSVEWMRANPQCGIAGAQLLDVDGSRQNSIANFPSLATELLNKSLLRRLFPHQFPGKEHWFPGPVEVESVVGAFMLVRRTTWEQVGGLDERFFFFFEETDFCFQSRRLGWKTYHLPHVEVWHEQGRSAKQVPAVARIEYWRSRYSYFEKNRGPGACRLLRFGLLVRSGMDWLLNGLLVLVTLGLWPRPWYRWTVDCALWDWHLRGCPTAMGLPR
jgi:GT2 family glycosyltransferase